MISKGTLHSNGKRLARYMLEAKDGERVALGQMRGFAADNLIEAFSTIDAMALATQGEKPFFHVQVRNPLGETLTREQWFYVADRIERTLGLGGQPRGITFHIDKETLHEHMHLGFSRVDEATMTLKPLPYFKLRLKDVSRALEQELGLTVVRNSRRDTTRAPSRNEEEQGRRLGLEARDVRSAIRDCWDRTDDGPGFREALRAEGMTLTRGDKRALVVVDERNGLYALGQRILGVKKAEMLERLHGLDLASLPTLAEARSGLAHRNRQKRGEGINHAAHSPRYAALDAAAAAVAKSEDFHFDRDRQNQVWDEGVQAAGRTHHAEQAKERGWRKLITPVTRQEAAPERRVRSSPDLKQTQADIRLSMQLTDDPRQFAEALGARKLRLARVISDENEPQQVPGLGVAARGKYGAMQPVDSSGQLEHWMRASGGYLDLSTAQRAEAKRTWERWIADRQKDNPARKWFGLRDYVRYVQQSWHRDSATVGPEDLAVVNQFGAVYRLTERTTGRTRKELSHYVQKLDIGALPTVPEAQAAATVQRDQERQDWRHARAAERAERKAAARTAYVERRSAEIRNDDTVKEIGRAYAETQTGDALVAMLETRGVLVVQVTAEDARRADVQRDYGLRAQRLAVGQYLAMNERGRVYRLDATTIHDDEQTIMARLAAIDASRLMSVGTARALFAEQRQDTLTPLDNGVDKGRPGRAVGHAARRLAAGSNVAISMGGSAARVAAQFTEGILGSLADFFTGPSGGHTQTQPSASKERPPSREEPASHVQDSLQRALQLLREAKVQLPVVAREPETTRHEDKERARRRER